ncbi:tyrosine-type recombinase/integrase [Clostridium coskatii]|nr:tyrosine-type recombinase/integrase [Clostridium coskatii]
MRKKIELQEIQEKNLTLEQGFKKFIVSCKVKNLRPSTIKHYKDIVGVFFKFIPKKTLCSEITKEIIDRFVIYMQENRKEKDVSINSTLMNLRVFIYYLMRYDYVPTFKISKLKVDKDIINTYSDAEIKILLKKPDLKKCKFLEYRNWVICNFLLGTGCRARTLVNLKIKDLDFENNLITYRFTKNRRQQIIPMSSALRNILLEYLEYRKGQEDDYLFVNAYGEYLKTEWLSHNLIDYNRKRGVATTGVHRWRHTFAKKWILNHGDIFRLQKILGHSSMDMVRNYVNMFQTDLSNEFDKFNPLDQMEQNRKGYIKMQRK